MPSCLDICGSCLTNRVSFAVIIDMTVTRSVQSTCTITPAFVILLKGDLLCFLNVFIFIQCVIQVLVHAKYL